MNMAALPAVFTKLLRKVEEHERTLRARVTDTKEKASALLGSARSLEESWSGSNFGYHWDLYYREFERPPWGEQFSVEWGGIHGLPPTWRQRKPEEVQAHIENRARATFAELKASVESLTEPTASLQSEIVDSLAAVQVTGRMSEELLARIAAFKWTDEQQKKYLADSLNAMPRGTRDSEAFMQGQRIPSHTHFEAVAFQARSHCEAIEEFWKLSKRLLNLTGLQSTAVPSRGTEAERRQLEMPDKLTLAWLFHNVPSRFWTWLGGLFLTTFLGGIYLGQVSWVRELLHTTSAVTMIPPEKVKVQIDELTKGHNERIAQLRKGIAEEEARAASSTYSSDQDQHRRAADRLRQDIKQDEEEYRRSLELLKSMYSSEP